MKKIAFLASEAVPYAKTGGLADVAGALPKYLAKIGADPVIVLPLYREVRKGGLILKKAVDGAAVEIGGRTVSFSVWEHSQDGVRALFIEHDGYFDRDCLYGTPSGDYPDNGERFGFYARASLESFKRLGFRPDVLHCHDWQSAMALAFLKFKLDGDPFFSSVRSLFTIHNLAYQGLFPKEILSALGLPDSLFRMDDLEFYGNLNFLKAGILYSSAVSTVSPTYSREIQTPEFGCGLDGLLRIRASVLHGVLNGVDYAVWDPSTDPLIPARFSARDRSGKAACREGLLKMFGLRAGTGVPVVGMVSRLAGQKGLDIVSGSLPELFKLDLRLVILGTGDAKIQDELTKASRAYPEKLGLRIAFDDRVARTIYAGSDLFLIPSRYEPCGLTQMYSLRYGTVPIVRATGGLEDSIQEYDPASGAGNGFKFSEASAPAMIAAVRGALAAFKLRKAWDTLVRNAMAGDFSWEKSAGEYMRLYDRITER
jgi:starch synthase